MAIVDGAIPFWIVAFDLQVRWCYDVVDTTSSTLDYWIHEDMHSSTYYLQELYTVYNVKLMIMPRLIPLLRKPLILQRLPQHHPLTKLIRLLSENLLPRSLALWSMIPSFSV